MTSFSTSRQRITTLLYAFAIGSVCAAAIGASNPIVPEQSRTLIARRFGDIRDPKTALPLLQRLAQEAIEGDDNLGRPRIYVVASTLHCDMRPVLSTSLALPENRLTLPLALLIQISTLRRDFAAVLPAVPAWRQPLNDIEKLLPAILTAAYSDSSADEWHKSVRIYESSVAASLDELNGSLLAYAAKHHLDLRRTREPATGYPVQIHIVPTATRIRFMPFLQYRLCVVFAMNLDDQWTDLNEGTHTLIGRYRYRAEWPTPEEGTFEIRATSTLNFRPKGR